MQMKHEGLEYIVLTVTSWDTKNEYLLGIDKDLTELFVNWTQNSNQTPPHS